jgi:hypothetical protein
MPGRRQVLPGKRALLGWVAVAMALLLAAATVLGLASPAGAATTVKAQLTLSGLADGDNPIGGSRIGVHPGDTVQISPSPAPTAGLAKLGLGGLVGGLLDGLASFQVTADFSHLPGGKANTVVKKGTKPLSFTFDNVGTYSFTWTAQKIGVLGGLVPIRLDGNQLREAGVKLNASNQYVGQIVVAKNPPKGGLGLQLPSVGVHPSVPVLGQLPSAGIPGVKVTVPVTVPDLNPPKPGKTAPHGGSHPAKPTTAPATQPGNVIPVPAQVVPRGGGNGVFSDGGFNTGILPGTGSRLGNSALLPVSSGSGSTATSAAGTEPGINQKSTGKDKTIELASDKASTGQLSVVLAIIAVIALTLVAATYARLYVLRRDS